MCGDCSVYIGVDISKLLINIPIGGLHNITTRGITQSMPIAKRVLGII